MADIFFSYTSADRERVRPIHDALERQGFEVFWDQEVPSGTNWDSWIRQNLAECKCAVVFWSSTSAASDNVRHEAAIAKDQGKLIPVLLEQLTVAQFPMGLYTTQAVNLVDWNGNLVHEGWRKLSSEIKAKLIPSWVAQEISELKAKLISERERRAAAERWGKALQEQIGKEVQIQQGLERDRDGAIASTAELSARVDELNRGKVESEARAAELSQHLSQIESGFRKERDKLANTISTLRNRVEELEQAEI